MATAWVWFGLKDPIGYAARLTPISKSHTAWQSSTWTETVTWTRQHARSDGRFKKHVVGNDQEAYDIRVIDMDKAGDLDLLVAGRGSRNIVWYEQN